MLFAICSPRSQEHFKTIDNAKLGGGDIRVHYGGFIKGVQHKSSTIKIGAQQIF